MYNFQQCFQYVVLLTPQEDISPLCQTVFVLFFFSKRAAGLHTEIRLWCGQPLLQLMHITFTSCLLFWCELLLQSHLHRLFLCDDAVCLCWPYVIRILASIIPATVNRSRHSLAFLKLFQFPRFPLQTNIKVVIVRPL